ncbi:MAG: hypothetical protein ACXIUV_09010, partial [Alkalilacustris sp.]
MDTPHSGPFGLQIPPASERVQTEQARGVRVIMAGAWIMVPVIVGGAWLSGQALLPFLGAALVVAVLSTLGARLRPDLARIAVSQALVGSAILLTSALSGHPWQLDSHMLFFAVLATFVLLIDPMVFLYATATIAVHHLTLGLFAPALVYPSAGMLENLQRTAFHAVVVVIETAALFVTVLRRRQTDAEVAAANAAERAHLDREAATREASLIEQRELVGALGRGLKALAEGDLTVRITRPLPPDYEEVRRDFNALGDNFGALIAEVQSGADGVREAAATLAASSSDMSHRAETQAATLEQSAAALDQMTASVRSAADKAAEADTAVGTVRR